MPLCKRAVTSSHGDLATSVSRPPYHSTSPQSPRLTHPSRAALGEKDLAVPKLREWREHSDGVPTLDSRLLCCTFAATGVETDYRVFRWMFNRRVIPQSVPSDPKFREEYSAMTSFIWPESWHSMEDLPSVDAALEPCVEELLESVATLKMQPGAVNCLSAKEFPVDLQVLGQSFSAIFQASRRSRERLFQAPVYEAAWRHDHDRLLYDFFIRLVQPGQSNTLVEGHSIAHLEDPLSRPSMEATLRFPKSNNLERRGGRETHQLIQKLIFHQAPDLESWLRTRGGSLDAMNEEDDNIAYVFSQFNSWRRENNAETESQAISPIGQYSSTGRCDALCRLLVELPNVTSKDVGHFPLVVHATGKRDGGIGKDVQASATRSWTRTGVETAHRKDQGNQPTKTSSNSLTVPDGSPGSAMMTNGARYTMLSSAVHPSMESSDKEQMRSAESMNALAFDVQGLRLESDATYLELPVLTVEYNKMSDASMKGTNQLRMYLASSVKFLQAIGITNVPVYGVQTDGPVVVLPAAVLGDDNFVYLFERLAERLDISTPLGAWHYATILCRLAQNHTKVLEKKFEEVRENLVTALLGAGSQMEEWTMDYQIARLKAENRAKAPSQKEKRGSKAEPADDSRN